jgi:hypothetical protein
MEIGNYSSFLIQSSERRQTAMPDSKSRWQAAFLADDRIARSQQSSATKCYTAQPLWLFELGRVVTP